MATRGQILQLNFSQISLLKLGKLLKGCMILLLNVAELLLETFFETKTTVLPYGSIKFSFQSGRIFEKMATFNL